MAVARSNLGALIASLALLPGLGCGSSWDSQSSDESTSTGSAHAMAVDDANASATDESLSRELSDLAQRGTGQVYIALLRPLNAGVNGRPVRGIAAVSVDSDVLDLLVLVKGLAPEMEHMQRIHGFIFDGLASCPSSGADTNRDNVIDVVEAAFFYGLVVVPLHSDLNELDPRMFPTASPDGILQYAQKGSVSVIERNLGAPLNLETRVIAVHGVAPTAPLPPTMQTLPGLTPAFTLPVACGELVRVK